MGEIAEMMLDGTMCQFCGEFFHDGEEGDGFPRSCESCSDDEKPEPKRSKSEVKLKNLVLGQKMIKRLRMCEKGEGGMYKGVRWDMAKSLHARLENLDLIEVYQPHNLIHLPRAVITEKGRQYLKQLKENQYV